MTEHRSARWSPLSPEIVARSLSPRELIFRLGDVRKALSQLVRAGYGLFGWEGIVRCPDGTIGHPLPQILGTESINRSADEAWNDNVERSVEFSRQTIEQSAAEWNSNSDRELCYAITMATPPPTYE